MRARGKIWGCQKTHKELVHVGAIFCINPLAPRFQRHPFYKHVFFKFLVGAHLFARNQVGHHQNIPKNWSPRPPKFHPGYICWLTRICWQLYLEYDPPSKGLITICITLQNPYDPWCWYIYLQNWVILLGQMLVNIP